MEAENVIASMNGARIDTDEFIGNALPVIKIKEIKVSPSISLFSFHYFQNGNQEITNQITEVENVTANSSMNGARIDAEDFIGNVSDTLLNDVSLTD